ncbi:stalk domain-containing protein [Paenibacillus durus]|uniref:stalk domain-containing protein n=1 Tax=Paenibacillus durus TaxID=44251 RepID=UPI00130E34FF
MYLPLRSVSQLLGAKVDYDGKRKWVKIQLNNHVLEINMMTNQTFYDSAEIQTDVKPTVQPAKSVCSLS